MYARSTRIACWLNVNSAKLCLHHSRRNQIAHPEFPEGERTSDYTILFKEALLTFHLSLQVAGAVPKYNVSLSNQVPRPMVQCSIPGGRASLLYRSGRFRLFS
jgi:hypothetical protein